MSDPLAPFLADRTPFATKTAVWNDGIELAVGFYLADALPPETLITSVRAVVLKDAEVLVFRDGADQYMILPGGRLEQGETLLAALHRELREETRCTIAEPLPIGFIHFRHTTPKPPDYAYPYPDFVQQVYAVRATHFDEAATIEDDWVAESFFAPVDDLEQYAIDEAELRFFAAAKALL